MEFDYTKPFLTIELTPEEIEQLTLIGTVSERNGGNTFAFDSTTTVRIDEGQRMSHAYFHGPDLNVVLNSLDIPTWISRHAVMGDETLYLGVDGGIAVHSLKRRIKDGTV